MQPEVKVLNRGMFGTATLSWLWQSERWQEWQSNVPSHTNNRWLVNSMHKEGAVHGCMAALMVGQPQESWNWRTMTHLMCLLFRLAAPAPMMVVVMMVTVIVVLKHNLGALKATQINKRNECALGNP